MCSSKYCVAIFALLLSGVAPPLDARADDKKSAGTNTPGPSPVAGKTLPSLRDIMLRTSMFHPRIQARARSLTAALKKARFSSWTYPDPRIGVFWLNGPYKRDLRFIRDKTPMTGIEYRLTQPIPFPGRLTIASKVADEDANIRRLQLALEKNTVAAEFLEMLVLARSIHRRLRLTRSYAERIRIVADAAETRYAVGKGNLADVSRAALKSQAYRDRTVELQGELDARVRRIAYYLVPRETKAQAEIEKTIRGIIESDSMATYAANLRGRIPADTKSLAGRSLLIALSKTKITRAEQKRTLARMNYLPDFEVFASYRKRAFIDNDPAQGENFMSFGITIRIPLWSGISNTHKTAARASRVEAARFSAGDMLRRESAMFDALRVRSKTTDKRIELYTKRLLPTASQALDSARLAYETGKVDFDVFLNSWDTLYMLEADRIRLRAKASKQLILLAMLYNEILPRVNIAKGGEK